MSIVRHIDQKLLQDSYQRALAELGVTTEALDPFGKVLSLQREKLIELAKRAANHEQFMQRHYKEIFNNLQLRVLDPAALTYGWHVDYFYYTQCQLSLTCDTIKQVVPIIKLLVHEGLKITTAPDKDSDSKLWRFRPRNVESCPVPFVLSVTAKSCKRVQVGVKEIPVYETQCEWGEDQKDLPTGEELEF